MSIIVEDGTGLTTATSYVSLDEADAYAYYTPAATLAQWNEYSDVQKNHLLAYATRLLDQRARWNGTKTVAASALRWPRQSAFDRDNLPVDPHSVPVQVKEAVCDIAMWLAFPGRGPFQVSDSQGIKSLTVDVLSVTYKDSHDATAIVALPPGLNHILKGLGSISYGTGSTFAPIVKA